MPTNSKREMMRRTLDHFLRQQNGDKFVRLMGFDEEPETDSRLAGLVEFGAVIRESTGEELVVKGLVGIEELRQHYLTNKASIMRRDFRPQHTTQEFQATPPSAGLTKQETWDTAMYRLNDLYRRQGPISPDEIGGEHRKPKFLPEANFNIVTKSLDGITLKTLGCRCVESLRAKHIMCDHVRWAFLNRMDAGLMFEDEPVSTVAAPIGMGNTWTVVTAKVNPYQKGVRWLTSPLHFALMSTLRYPVEPFTVSDGEGILPYVRYLEELIVETTTYQMMVDPRRRDSFCGRGHGPSVAAYVRDQLRPTNRYRLQWIYANVATILIGAESNPNTPCLGCAQLGVEDTVPKV